MAKVNLQNHSSEMDLVFTYGTLKSHQPNHHILSDSRSIFVAKGVTKTLYPLIIGTRHNIPCLLDCPGTGHNILGEIYLVTESLLKDLDEFEETPTVYQRERTDIEIRNRSNVTAAEPGDIVQCWIYKIKNYRPQLLETPFLEEYCSTLADYTELDEENDDGETGDYWSDILADENK